MPFFISDQTMLFIGTKSVLVKKKHWSCIWAGSLSAEGV